MEPQSGHPTKWNELRSKRKQVFGREITEVLQRTLPLVSETLRERGACVEFNKTDHSIRTSSAEQVRQPIFREGLDQRRNYGSAHSRSL